MSDNRVTTLYLFRQYAGLDADTDRDKLLTNLIEQVCDQMAEVCGRVFGVATYREWYDGAGNQTMMLRQWPVLRLYRVSVSSQSALDIGYTGTGKHADVNFDGTTLYLHSIDATGTDNDTEIAVADYPILSSLADAASAVTDWSGSTSSSSMDTEPSSLLRGDVSAFVASGDSVSMAIPDDGIEVQIVPGTTRAVGAGYGSSFPTGTRNIFAWYKAGYTLPADNSQHTQLSTAGTVPPGLTMIANRIIKDTYDQSCNDITVTAENTADHQTQFGQWGRSAIERHWADLSQYREKGVA